MSSGEIVRVTTIVAVDPATAFEVFTREIGLWWRSDSGSGLRFEGGRLLDGSREVGRVVEWKPGEWLVFGWDYGTEVEVRFEGVAGGTRVSLEHRGWEKVPANHPARHGYTGSAFTGMLGLRWADGLNALRRRVAQGR